MLSDPDRRTNKIARRYLLVRLLRCGHCGETLVSRPEAGRRPCLPVRERPGLLGLRQDVGEGRAAGAFVVEAVLYRLDSPELAAALSGEPGDPDAERWQAEIDQSRARAGRAGRDVRPPRDQPLGVAGCPRPVEQRITEAKKELGRLTRTSALAGHVGNAASYATSGRPCP